MTLKTCRIKTQVCGLLISSVSRDWTTGMIHNNTTIQSTTMLRCMAEDSVIYFIQLAHPLFQVLEEPLATGALSSSSSLHVKMMTLKCRRPSLKAWVFLNLERGSILPISLLRALGSRTKMNSFKQQLRQVCKELM